LLREKNLTKKKYKFCQKRKVYLRKNIGFVKREKFSQKKGFAKR
jgi:hypothetical protein